MGFIDKVCGKLGLSDSTDVDDIQVIREIKPVEPQKRENKPKGIEDSDIKFPKSSSANNNVVNLHTAANGSATVNLASKQVKVMVMEPVSFDDAQHVADYLRNRKPVVINFENTETEIAKRIIDFISGTTYALAGNLQKVANNIFLCAPSNVDVSFSQQTDTLDKVVMPWMEK